MDTTNPAGRLASPLTEGLGRCASCRWWDYFDGNGEIGGTWQGFGTCRLLPPSIQQPHGGLVDCEQPVTTSRQGCAQWKEGPDLELEFNGASSKKEWPFSDQLGCYWCAWRVISADTLELVVPPDSYPDMNECIELATRLLPGVKRITTTGAEDGTAYELRDDAWIAKRASASKQE